MRIWQIGFTAGLMLSACGEADNKTKESKPRKPKPEIQVQESRTGTQTNQNPEM